MGRTLKATLRAGRWAVLLGLAALLVAAFLLPRLTGASTYTVLSGSMRPALEPGALVVVRPADADDIGVGSVITYQLRSGHPEVVTHRVVEQGIGEDGQPVFRTKGDTNSTPDKAWVQPGQVRGTLWYSLPYVGHLGEMVPYASKEVIIVLAAVSLLGYAVRMFATGIRDRRRVSHA
jgi:signal peptidase I